MKKLIVGFVAAAASISMGDAAVIAYWNFNDLSITTASAPGSGGVPTSISADSGTGTLSLASWSGLVDDFAGSTINALNSDPAEESLSLVSGGSSGGPYLGNNSYIDISFSLAGYQDLIVSFAARGTASGFDTGTWSYSINGGGFSSLAGTNTATRSTTFALATADFSAISALDNAASVTLRYTVSGATSNSGNNRIDNLQISATAVPEPATAVTLIGGIGAMFWTIRRRRVA